MYVREYPSEELLGMADPRLAGGDVAQALSGRPRMAVVGFPSRFRVQDNVIVVWITDAGLTQCITLIYAGQVEAQWEEGYRQSASAAILLLGNKRRDNELRHARQLGNDTGVSGPS